MIVVSSLAVALVVMGMSGPAPMPEHVPAIFYRMQERIVKEGQYARWWADLASDDMVVSGRARDNFMRNERESVPYFRQHLQGRGLTNLEQRIAALVKDLDNDDFEIRDGATRQLQALGDDALVPLQRALRETSSPEVRLRLRMVLGDRLTTEGVLAVERRRLLRVVYILDFIGTPEARVLLWHLAQTGPDEEVRAKAQWVLDRGLKGL